MLSFGLMELSYPALDDAHEIVHICVSAISDLLVVSSDYRLSSSAYSYPLMG